MSAAVPATGPVTLLIAALGGEGGGVLTDWIVAAARAADLPVQATSIPGVAQRTGATTYYLEIWPEPWAQLGGRAPVLALSPAPGEVDVLAASELLEAGRMIQSGFVTPDRTMVVGSTHRVYATIEKMAMADGRYDRDRLVGTIGARACARVLVDMQQLARAAEAPISAVMLGALAGSGALPVTADRLRAAIRAEGKAVEANLRGFEAGLAAARSGHAPSPAAAPHRADPVADVAALADRVAAAFPASVQPTLAHAVRRLTDYQDAAYAALYLDRLMPFAAGDPALLDRVARHLAVRMSYEDIIRVAQAKSRATRFAGIRQSVGAAANEPVVVTEFFKPGFAELCDILPARLAARLVALADRWPALRGMQRAMRLRSTTLWGYGRLRLLARLARWRRGTWRFQHEQVAIVEWLGMVEAAAGRDPRLAVEIAECARLVKGYGDTHRRGSANFRRITDVLIRPALAEGGDAAATSTAIAGARAAALADPEGAALTRALAAAPVPPADGPANLARAS